MRKKFFLLISSILVALIIVAASFFVYHFARAEQSGGSPESGATSQLKTIYNSLVALGHGSDAAGGWGDWGAYLNRLRSAGEWVPADSSGVTDVKSGKTFHTTSRTQQTGTYPNPTNCSTQQWNDAGGSATEGNNCSLTWTTNPSPVAGDDDLAGRGGLDQRTGLQWSQYLKNNAGTVEFADSGGSTWNWDGTDNAQGVNNKAANGGVAPGKTAKQLCSERGNGWRLPTQKELMQAYIDGSYWNLTQPTSYFWSATEFDATTTWVVRSGTGGIAPNNKATAANNVRCVRP